MIHPVIHSGQAMTGTIVTKQHVLGLIVMHERIIEGFRCERPGVHAPSRYERAQWQGIPIPQ